MAEATTTHRVEVERGKKFQLVHVPGIGHSTQARKLGEVREMAQDLIELMADEGAEDIELDVHVRLPPDVAERLGHVEQLRAAAAQAQGDAAGELRKAAQGLRDRGLTLREIGEVLGLSYQRAHQLVSDEKAA